MKGDVVAFAVTFALLMGMYFWGHWRGYRAGRWDESRSQLKQKQNEERKLQ